MADDIAVITDGTLRFSGSIDEMRAATPTGNLDDAYFALTGGETR